MSKSTTPYFGHGTKLYAIRAASSHGDLFDAISMRLRQTDAALLAIIGDGFESFSCLNPERQDDYLWMLSSMVAEARDLLDAAMDSKRSEESNEALSGQ